MMWGRFTTDFHSSCLCYVWFHSMGRKLEPTLRICRHEWPTCRQLTRFCRHFPQMKMSNFCRQVMTNFYSDSHPCLVHFSRRQSQDAESGITCPVLSSFTRADRRLLYRYRWALVAPTNGIRGTNIPAVRLLLPRLLPWRFSELRMKDTDTTHIILSNNRFAEWPSLKTQKCTNTHLQKYTPAILL